MKNQTKSNWRNQMLFAAAATLFFIFAASSQTFGQKFKPGDRVECDVFGNGSFGEKGTVVEYLENDKPIYKGEYYLTRVKIDKWTDYTEGALFPTDKVRLLKVTTPLPKEMPKEETANQPNEKQPDQNRQNGNKTVTEVGAKFKPGDRVECDGYKGTVLPFEENDKPGLDKDKSGEYFYIHRVRLDFEASVRPGGGMCFTDRTRLLAGGAPMEIPKTEIPIGKVTTDADNTLSADRPIIECPVAQTPVRNGARPNAELLKKITRCDKGEKPASKGYDGAVTVDVTAIQIAAPRQLVYSRDIGGKPGTVIYPVRVTYTVKTFYRTRTVVAENWVRTINFYVNDFGEWQSGSEEPVKSPASKDIPRLP